MNLQTTQHQQNRSQMVSLIYKIKEYCDRANIGFLAPTTEPNKIFSSSKKYWIWVITHDLIYNRIDFVRINNSLIAAGKQLLICTDNFGEVKNFSNIKFLCHDVLIGINHFHVDTAHYIHIRTNKPEKLLNCFVQRIESVRQSWLYFLHHHNLIDKGYISYLCYPNVISSELEGVELYDYTHSHYQLNEDPNFETAYHALRNQIPYRNFVENGNLYDKILDSKYSLVLDTYATADDGNFLFSSEKMYRALMYPTCHLFFSQKGLLTQFSKSGFEISQSNLDFDSLDWITRQQKILELLVNDTDEYKFDYLKSRALYNYNHLKSMYDSNIDQFYDEIIDIAQSQFS
jgi:hypothetical protein